MAHMIHSVTGRCPSVLSCDDDPGKVSLLCIYFPKPFFKFTYRLCCRKKNLPTAAQSCSIASTHTWWQMYAPFNRLKHVNNYINSNNTTMNSAIIMINLNLNFTITIISPQNVLYFSLCEVIVRCLSRPAQLMTVHASIENLEKKIVAEYAVQIDIYWNHTPVESVKNFPKCSTVIVSMKISNSCS